MTRRRIVDLTIPISSGMDAFPGEPTARFTPFSTLGDGGIEMWRVDLFSQLGTHVDAPAHFVEGGAGVDRMDLDALIGPAVVLDVPGSGELGPDAFAARAAELREAGRVLLRTGWSARVGTPGYWSGFPTVSPAAARELVALGVRFVGLDTPTPSTTHLHEVHRVLLEAGVVLAECLVGLERLTLPRVELVALPLPLVGLDGAPARIVAIETA